MRLKPTPQEAYSELHGSLSLRRYLQRSTGKAFIIKHHDHADFVLLDVNTLMECSVPAAQFKVEFVFVVMDEMAFYMEKDPKVLESHNRAIEAWMRAERTCLESSGL